MPERKYRRLGNESGISFFYSLPGSGHNIIKKIVKRSPDPHAKIKIIKIRQVLAIEWFHREFGMKILRVEPQGPEISSFIRALIKIIKTKARNVGRDPRKGESVLAPRPK